MLVVETLVLEVAGTFDAGCNKGVLAWDGGGSGELMDFTDVVRDLKDVSDKFTGRSRES